MSSMPRRPAATKARPPLWAGALALVLTVAGAARLPAQATEPFHVVFTAAMIGGVSRTDAQAAIDVWGREIASTRGLHLAVSSEFIDTIEEVRAAVDAHRVHVLALSVEQYAHLQRPEFGDVLMGLRHGRQADEFLLVTRKGAVTQLAGLKGTTLQTIDGPDRDMELVWLESILHEHGLPPAARHFATVAAAPKTARGVLPVYFGQAAACLVSRTAFDLMVELNPQIGTALTALDTSPPLVSGVLLLDRKYAPALRPRLLDALASLHDSPRGLQVLSLFAIDRIISGVPGALAPSLDLVRQVDRLRRGPR